MRVVYDFASSFEVFITRLKPGVTFLSQTVFKFVVQNDQNGNFLSVLTYVREQQFATPVGDISSLKTILLFFRRHRVIVSPR